MAIDLMEASVGSLQSSYAAGSLTCEQVVQFCLDRIERYDRAGPKLTAIINFNPNALDIARELDARFREDPASIGPLHGIPVILKDNYNTKDVVTTGGSVILKNSQPDTDAFIAGRLRAAGAIILAKSNLGELARNAVTASSLGGQTKNPYDLSRTNGGSSGGTGAAIAANFGVLGTGSDTGQSTRSPASAASLVGVRGTKGLLSRAGIIPLSGTQDEPGPITRSVADAARMLDVMAGYDPADPVTALSQGKRPASYLESLDGATLAGARLGLLTDFVGNEERHQEVNAVLAPAVETIRGLGAAVIEVSIPRLEDLTANIATATFEFRELFNSYLASLPQPGAVKDLDEFIADGRFLPSLRPGLETDAARENPRQSEEYMSRILRRQTLREAVAVVMAENRLDALLYPHQQILVATIGEEQLERNGVLSNSTGFPAVTFAGGFSVASETAPLGVPIGIELLGLDWTEPALLRYAQAFETHARVRRPPLSVPDLQAV